MRGTAMAKEYEAHPEDFKLFALDDYIDCVIDYIERLRDDLVLERFVSQAPKSLLIAPDWGLKNYEFTAKIKRRMVECGAWQGRLFVNN
jgi:radical SAM superfamily enzyme